MKQAAAKYAVPALDKGLDILEYMALQEMPKSQSEIAVALERGTNEIYRMLVNLEARGYLHRDEISGKYQTSLKIYNLSRRISPIYKMRQCALPHMEDLASSIGHACHLSMLYQSQTMVMIQAQSHSPISISIAEGSIFPTLSTASGKILLANSNQEVKSMILERDDSFTKMSNAAKEQLFTELDGIQSQGFHTEKSQFSEGIIDYSALIGEPEGLVVAALTVSTINGVMSSQLDTNELKNKIVETAHKIALQLGVVADPELLSFGQ
ncbi:IclR family transcriptional regulator [Vibrio sp. FNV 38]|nr:IclR family transcriptional regulator [Vibrio sp. FNV 38]